MRTTAGLLCAPAGKLEPTTVCRRTGVGAASRPRLAWAAQLLPWESPPAAWTGRFFSAAATWSCLSVGLWVEAPFLPTPIKWHCGGNLPCSCIKQGFPINATAQRAQIYGQSASPPEGFKKKPGSQREPALLSLRGNLVLALPDPLLSCPERAQSQ